MESPVAVKPEAVAAAVAVTLGSMIVTVGESVPAILNALVPITTRR
jgi:hypothetical protein